MSEQNHPDQDRAAAALKVAEDQAKDRADAVLMENLNTMAVDSERMLRFFRFDHLPKHLKDASRPFAELALRLVTLYPRDEQRVVAIQKLLEAKDAAVRTLVK